MFYCIFDFTHGNASFRATACQMPITCGYAKLCLIHFLTIPTLFIENIFFLCQCFPILILFTCLLEDELIKLHFVDWYISAFQFSAFFYHLQSFLWQECILSLLSSNRDMPLSTIEYCFSGVHIHWQMLTQGYNKVILRSKSSQSGYCVFCLVLSICIAILGVAHTWW